MKLNHRLVLATAAVLSVIVSADAAQNILLNGSFENSDPNALDPFVPGGWELNGNVIERSAEANLVPALPPGEGHALKAFQSNPTELAFQEIAVVGGTDTVTISAELFTRNFDKVGGDAIAGIGLGFFDAGNNQVGGSTQFDFVMDASSPADTWIPASVGPVLAPVGATKARMTCVWISNNGSGAAFWDDAKLTLNGDPTNLLANGDFELAGEGEASPNAIDDWGGFEDQRPTNDFSLHGDTSLRIGTGAPFNGLFQSTRDVFENERVLVRGKVLHTSTNGLTANAVAGLKLEFSAPGGSTVPSPSENFPFDADSTSNAWVMIDIGSVGIEVPDTASIARITMIMFPDTSTNSVVYFDQAFASLSRAPSTNLLLNPSFENGFGGPNGIDNWVEFGPEAQLSFEVGGLEDDLVTEDFFEASAKMAGNDFTGLSQDIALPSTLLPNESLYVRAFVRQQDNEAQSLQGTARAGVKIEWVAGTVPPPVDIGSGANGNTIDSSSPTDVWIPLEIDFTMPSGNAAVPRVVCISVAGAGSGEVYFDNVEAVITNRYDGADADGDDDEDLFDFAELQRCFNGDGAGELDWNCSVFDEDEDIDIDLVDFNYFQARLTGP
jgi:hypothetical protein